jgi:hypothetical protein
MAIHTFLVDKNWRSSIFAIVLASGAVGAVNSIANAKDYGQLGKLGFAHWRCAAFGFLSESAADKNLSEKLFLSGHQMLSELVSDLIAGKAKEQDLKEVPVGIRWWLIAGPTVEFRMGYMWAQFEKDAYDKTWPSLKDASFNEQKAIQELKAGTEFQNGNCQLLN